MDFFQHQDAARGRTRWLVVLFILAVICIIAAVYAVVAAFIVFFAGQGKADPALLMQPELIGGVALGVIAVVGSGSLYKIAQLSGGGDVLAAELGGRFVSQDTTDLEERKLLNVVEEMSIASGVPVPPVYVMDNEDGINAFAAGYSPSNAVIGVTRGSIRKLTRDELQGVIAHEFSHILNGDMRLNVRLIGLIHGILVVGLIGYFIFRSALHGSRYRSRRDSKNNPLPLIALGLGLMIVGYAGTFFGRLIKAAVSRQREFLADAAAVQFTRHPQGLAGALQKIGGAAAGSRIQHPRAEEASHMFFGQGVSLSSLFATHPPLHVRIRRILPDWDGEFTPVPVETAPPAERAARPARDAAKMGLAGEPGASSPLVERIRAAREAAARGQGPQVDVNAIESIGQPSPAHIVYAEQLMAAVPGALKAAAHDRHGSRALVYAMLLDANPQTRQAQLQRLAQQVREEAYRATLVVLPELDGLDRAARIPLIDLAMPALRAMTPDEYADFRRVVDALIQADERVDLFEWTLRRIILRHLHPAFEAQASDRVRFTSLRSVMEPIVLLLSTTAHVGQRTHEAAQGAFDAGMRQIGVAANMLPREACGLNDVDNALDVLAAASPGIKQKFLSACATCIAHDRTVTPREGELLRAIADALDCPMPPLLPGQALI